MKKAIVCIIAIVLALVLEVVATSDRIQLRFFEAKYVDRPTSLILGELFVYSEDDKIIILTDSHGPNCVAVYDTNRALKTSINCTPIFFSDVQQYVGMSYEAIQRELGAYHMNTGEGFHTPSYLTSDGHVVCFRFKEDNTAWLVQKYDLFTGQSVELHVSPEI